MTHRKGISNRERERRASREREEFISHVETCIIYVCVCVLMRLVALHVDVHHRGEDEGKNDELIRLCIVIHEDDEEAYSFQLVRDDTVVTAGNSLLFDKLARSFHGLILPQQ